MSNKVPRGAVHGKAIERRAFTLIELIVTTVLLGTVLVTITPLLGWVAAERRAADQRQHALHETANLLERLSAREWDEITPEAVAGMELSPRSRQFLREPELKIDISETGTGGEDGEAAAKRISIELRWKNRAGDFLSPARLATFVYRNEGMPE